jgi:hypothetical protein
MTEPRRLIETCDAPLERAILSAGVSVKASGLARERTLEALFGDVGEARGVVSMFPPRKRRMLLVALSISTLAAAMPLAYYAWQKSGPSPAEPAVKTEVSSVSESDREVLRVPAAQSAAQEDELEPLPTEGERTSGTTEAGKRRSGNAEVGTTSGNGKAVEPNLLTAELTALDAARTRLHSGDPKGALQLLDAYQRDFPRPRLALEAEVLRIFAYDKAGQKQTAKKRAEAFVLKYPKGVLSSRVRRYLEQ